MDLVLQNPFSGSISFSFSILVFPALVSGHALHGDIFMDDMLYPHVHPTYTSLMGCIHCVHSLWIMPLVLGVTASQGREVLLAGVERRG